MKALFICLDYYPRNGARTSLQNRLLRVKLQRIFGEVHALTIEKPTEAALQKFLSRLELVQRFNIEKKRL